MCYYHSSQDNRHVTIDLTTHRANMRREHVTCHVGRHRLGCRAVSHSVSVDAPAQTGSRPATNGALEARKMGDGIGASRPLLSHAGRWNGSSRSLA